jgi:hypothetical protein
LKATKAVKINGVATKHKAALDPDQGTHLVPLSAVKGRDLRDADFQVTDREINIILPKK